MRNHWSHIERGVKASSVYRLRWNAIVKRGGSFHWSCNRIFCSYSEGSTLKLPIDICTLSGDNFGYRLNPLTRYSRSLIRKVETSASFEIYCKIHSSHSRESIPCVKFRNISPATVLQSHTVELHLSERNFS